MGSCLTYLLSFSLSERQIAPLYCMLVNSPSIFVHCDSGFIQIVLNFFQILFGVHRVHGVEKHRLPVPFVTSSSRNQSTLDDGVHVVSVPDVVDVLGEVIRQQYIVLHCRINESTSLMSLDCSEVQDMCGRIGVHAVLKPFLRSSSFCQEGDPTFN